MTAAVLCFIHSVRPEILDNYNNTRTNTFRPYRIIIIFVVITLITAGIISIFASKLPDGLEWAIEKTAGEEELENPDGAVHSAAENIVNSTAIMPDYNFSGDNQSLLGTASAGVVGSIITVVIAGGVGLIIHIVKRKQTGAS